MLNRATRRQTALHKCHMISSQLGIMAVMGACVAWRACVRASEACNMGFSE